MPNETENLAFAANQSLDQTQPLLASPATTPPAAPVIASWSPDSGVVGDGLTNASQLTFTGTAADSATVNIFDDATLIGTVTADATGAWSLTTPALPDGSQVFTATATDSAGQTSAASSPLSVIVDTTPPAAPVLTGESIVNVNQVVLTGTAEANSAIKIYNGTTVIGTGITDAKGAFSVTTVPLPAGSYDFTATATDAAGNVSAMSAPIDPVTGTPNAIVAENQLAGTPMSVWWVDPGQDSTKLEGFTTQMGTNVGGTVQFKIDNLTGNGSYTISIYRLGYYGGDGARLVTTINHSGGVIAQPAALTDPSTGLVDAGNWSVTDSWNVPTTAVSGVYIANVTQGSQVFQIPFIVSDPSSTSDIIFQTADETWQAYNPWGGADLYAGNGPGYNGSAYAVSYNRPITTRDSSYPGFGSLYGSSNDMVFSAEFPTIYWLEQNGYNVSYISGQQLATAPNDSLLLNHKVYMDSGHDEYWTDQQYANVQAAGQAGVSLMFLSGNEAYWQTRFAPSIDATSDPNRTLVSYKDTHANTLIDPSGTATSTFMDARFASTGGLAGTPSNALTGQVFSVDSERFDTLTIPYGMTQLRIWDNTAVANTQPGGTASLQPGILGYEWDSSPDNGFRPGGLVSLSSTTLQVSTLLLDYGNTTGNGTATHNLVEFRDPVSGALVFSTGTVFWSWGLSDQHDVYQGTLQPVDPSVQQATVNVLADMGVQPQTLQASLVLASATTDHTAPTSYITSLSTTSIVEGSQMTVTGTATDVGGVIGGVEVSTDGGNTWHPATSNVGAATVSWSYTFKAGAAGTFKVESRAVDDSINLETPSDATSYTVLPSSNLSIFSATATPAVANTPDNSPIEVGVKFVSADAGMITGIRFYKGSQNTGTHIGDLWSSSGQLLASATFSNETSSGWQQVSFASPVAIQAGQTYIASYWTSSGYYSTTNFYFDNAGTTNGALTATGSGLNGVYAYGSGPIFPNNVSFTNSDNYWVDVVFDDTNSGGPQANSDSGFTVTENGSISIAASALLANDTDTNGLSLSLTGVSGPVNGTVSYNSQTQMVTFTPTANYAGLASFLYTIKDTSGASATGAVSLNVTYPVSAQSLFGTNVTPAEVNSNDGSPVELGVKFTATTNGKITGIRFYKGTANVGTHIGDLWSSSGQLLATATFTNETSSGWQQVNFSTPVAITAGTTYVAAYHTNGYYSDTANYFTSPVTNGNLTAPTAGNGVYAYGSTDIFPTNTYKATNYWVDVVFNGSSGGLPPVANNDSGFSTVENTALNIAASALLANDTDPNGLTLSIAGVSGPVNGTVSYNSQTQTVTFTPTTGYTGAANFTYSITDADGGTASANVALTVNVAPPPVANNDSGFSTNANTALSIAASALLANDTDPNGLPLSITGVSSPANGTVSYNSQTQIVTFTPTSNYTGPASFTYSITDADGGTASANVALTVGNSTVTTENLFSLTSTPTSVTVNDPSAVELGVKFTADANGSITGIRFYKGPSNTGTHIGDLWSSTGTLLASATFTGETASGWQQVNFSTPVAITAGVTYVAAYHTNVGEYSASANYFSSNVVSGDLTAPASGNGVYAYGATDTFPTSTYNATNYWVDVVYTKVIQPPPVANNDSGFSTVENTALNIAASALLANDTDPNGLTLSIAGVSSPVNGTVSYNSQTQTVTFTPTTGYTGPANFTYSITDAGGGTASASVALTVNAAPPPVANNDSGFSTNLNTALNIPAAALLANDTDPNGLPLSITGVSSPVNGTVSYNSQTQTVTFTPTSNYTGPANFTYSITDADGGTASANVALTVSNSVATESLFGTTSTPATVTVNDPNAIELGVKFTAAANGSITGIRFYKGPSNTGTHIADLWSSTGTLLASATFTGETASGWQQVNFSTPVAITAGMTYVAAYHTNVGEYSASGNYFTSNVVSGDLTAPASGNGVYAYGGTDTFPTSTYNATNYWVDVVYTKSTGVLAPVANNDSGFVTTENTALAINASQLLANDTDPNGLTPSITGVSSPVNGTVSYNSQTQVVTFTPTSNYAGAASFTYSITDADGGTASANVALTVNNPNTATLFSASSTPSIVTVNDPNAVELGVKFTSSQSGAISGIRFYKGPQNTGTHVADLWSSTGTLLATATFTNETTSGWQEADFSTPVNIAAGTTYVASYHTNTGEYSADPNLFATSLANGPLTAPSSSSSGGNGVYAYGGSSLFPTNSYNATSYGVDVVFKAQLAA
ncbi:DUF4082 domain-containing protein [Rhodoblastus acidophilus]|uniref:DUF4082 domain-containing protein n=1 Tax=Candidatus Rhodoblastus alkanivorans TaxID=2954117 RepID=A0ABS9Z9P4_9HYPH|nr:DUF4082 domain-containing protein [Candidatus Rhodoblastus alkanivorans]MCI4677062.1 DUF4082 domain-containing protein [Candidatus Rhodoblastus alkanivorans]MCI4684415.1 DUF4082 domain-containing protein [Candidatus Rhodoblastus alkanivorans]MDI4641736.1 DUF4082 domain-containing protein [Rhodoblastus acidophilus]